MSSTNTSRNGATNNTETKNGQEQKIPKEQEEALQFLILIIAAVVAWALMYFRSYVFWIVWVLITHVLVFGIMVYAGAYVPGLSRFFGPQRGPRQSIVDHNKMWYDYMTSFGTLTYGFMYYMGLSALDYGAGGYLIWTYHKSECFSFLVYYLIDLPTYFIGTIMWVLLLLVGHITLIISLFYILSSTNWVGPDIADGGDDPRWMGFDDLDFLNGEKNNVGDKNMTMEQARSYLGLKTDVVYDRKSMRKQYHKVCAKWHPDKNPNNIRAKAYFQKIQDAYELLGPKAMRNNRLRELGKISFQAISAYSVFDLLVSYIFGYGTIWIYKWPTFWFIWLEVMHCLLAYALQLIVKSVATMPKIFSTWINILMLVSIISFFDYAMGSNIIWIENWPFPYLIAAPSQIPGLIDSLPFNALWLFRVYCSVRMLLRGFVNVSVQNIDFPEKYTGDEKDHADAIVIFNGFLNICFTLILIALDYYMYQNSGWIWRSRKESGWFFVILSFFWSYFGLDITQAIGHESWGDFLVGFTVLAPSHTTWFDAFMLGVGIYVFMRIQRGIIYTDFALRLLRDSPFGPSILNFAKDLRQMAEAEIEKQKEEEEKRKQEEDKNIEKNILPANVDLSYKDGDDSNKKFS